MSKDAANNRDRENDDWRRRAHLQIDALFADAKLKTEFYGSLVVEVFFQNNQVIGFDSNLTQKVRK